jgi:hypothetical protein
VFVASEEELEHAIYPDVRVVERRGIGAVTAAPAAEAAVAEPVVPLRKKDKDITLEHQPLIDACYRNGVYDDIDYRRPPVPPLEPEEETWAEELLKGQSLRK